MAGEAASNKRNADKAMASRMKAAPNQFPDSVRRPHMGNGAEYRRGAHRRPYHELSTFAGGMLGGILCARLGMGDFGIPREML